MKGARKMCESINNDEKINVYFLKTDYTNDFIGFTKEQLFLFLGG